MGFSYNIPKYQIIPNEQIKIISEYLFRILTETGIEVYHKKILDAQYGIELVSFCRRIFSGFDFGEIEESFR